MAMIGVRCTRGLISLEEHNRCQAETGAPPCGFSTTVLNLMLRPNKEREGVQFSPSSLAACHRRTVLSRRHDWFLGVKDSWAMVKGTAFHEGLAHEPPPPGSLGVIRELRLETPIKVDGVDQLFKGKADEIVLLSLEHVMPEKQAMGEHGEFLTMRSDTVLHVRLVDHKTRASIPPSFNEPYRDNIYQINSYAYLLEHALADWLNSSNHGKSFEEMTTEAAVVDREMKEHLFLSDGVSLPHIDKIVVDEMVLAYMGMDTTRTFSSMGFRYDVGKSGQSIELSPIQHFEPDFALTKIREGIKRQMDSEVMLAPPLEADRSYIMCGSCAVRRQCIETGKEEGYNMHNQTRYE